MNTGIQDAFNLSWKLAYVMRGLAQPQLLDTYNTERQPVAEALLNTTDRGFRVMVEPNNLTELALKFLGSAAFHNDTLMHKVRDVVEEVKINYWNSPLNQDRGGHSALRAGDRAPDATVVHNRLTVRLFQVLQGTQWNLLLFSGRTSDATSTEKLLKLAEEISVQFSKTVRSHFVTPTTITTNASTLHDRLEYLHEKYGIQQPHLCLIRPDGYIGFQGGIDAIEPLKHYLAQVLIEDKSK